MEKTKCVEYRGIRDVVAAKVITDTTEKFECDTPFSVCWTSELSRETANSSETHYYDNVPASVIDSTGADTVGVNTSAMTNEVIAKLTGQYYDEELDMLVEGEREADYYALGYVTETTDGEEMLVWRHKGKFGIPSSTHGTKDDGTGANGQELTYTGIMTVHKFAKSGKASRALNLPKSKCPMTEEEFFATVQTVDTIETAKAAKANANSGEEQPAG